MRDENGEPIMSTKTPRFASEQEVEDFERRQRARQKGRTMTPDELVRGAKIPARHDGLDLTDDQDRHAEQIWPTLAAGAIWAIVGPQGRGKTALAVHLVKRVCCELRLPALYAKTHRVILEFRRAMGNQSRSELDVIQQHARPQLLVLDQFEERGETDYEDRLLAHLIDERYDAMRSTVIVSNQTRDGLSQSLGPSIVDRIRETGGVIECDWESFRRY